MQEAFKQQRPSSRFVFPLNRDLDDDDANDRRSRVFGAWKRVKCRRREEMRIAFVSRFFGEAFLVALFFRRVHARIPLPFPFLLSVVFFSTHLPTRLVSTRSKVLTRVYFCVRENRSSAPASRAYRTL